METAVSYRPYNVWDVGGGDPPQPDNPHAKPEYVETGDVDYSLWGYYLFGISIVVLMLIFFIMDYFPSWFGLDTPAQPLPTWTSIEDYFFPPPTPVVDPNTTAAAVAKVAASTTARTAAQIHSDYLAASKAAVQVQVATTTIQQMMMIYQSKWSLVQRKNNALSSFPKSQVVQDAYNSIKSDMTALSKSASKAQTALHAANNAANPTNPNPTVANDQLTMVNGIKAQMQSQSADFENQIENYNELMTAYLLACNAVNSIKSIQTQMFKISQQIQNDYTNLFAMTQQAQIDSATATNLCMQTGPLAESSAHCGGSMTPMALGGDCQITNAGDSADITNQLCPMTDMSNDSILAFQKCTESHTCGLPAQVGSNHCYDSMNDAKTQYATASGKMYALNNYNTDMTTMYSQIQNLYQQAQQAALANPPDSDTCGDLLATAQQILSQAKQEQSDFQSDKPLIASACEQVGIDAGYAQKYYNDVLAAPPCNQ